MQQKVLLIESQYLPPISYFASLIYYGDVKIEQHEHFQKSTFRNRCYISGPNGKLRLSVPLASGKHQRSTMREVRISYDEDWQKIHWHSICASYRRSPFFEFYEEGFAPFFERKHEYLFGLNQALLEYVIDLLKIEVRLGFTEKYMNHSPEDVADLRSAIHPNKDESLSYFSPPRYRQVFEERTGFFPDLSILDLLFNEGPQAAGLIRKSLNED